MCLILVAWQVHDRYPLVLAANRDEYYRRPTLPLGAWPEAPHILGGKDLEAGGGWLACRAPGRWAAVTNVREAVTGVNKPHQALESRGDLVGNYLKSGAEPIDFIDSIQPNNYAGFNLLLGQKDGLWFFSNRNGGQATKLTPGIYGLSNHTLETPWPKLVAARAAFTQALTALPDSSAFFNLLANRSIAADAHLPSTGVSLEVERLLSAIFVQSAHYGTRASTLMLGQADAGFVMLERSFGPDGRPLGERVAQSSTISTGV